MSDFDIEIARGNENMGKEIEQLKSKLDCAVGVLEEYITFYDDKTKDMCEFEDFRFEWVKRARLALGEIRLK